MPATVLLLDRRDDSRAAYAGALRSAGLHVVETLDSQRALDEIIRIRPRVIVASFDSETRDDRLSLCRAIKASSRTSRIPILLVASEMTPEDVGLATDPGAMVLTLVPSEAATLVAAVNGVLTAQRAEPLRATPRRRGDARRSA